MNEKMQAIFDSFINGQITQMVDQIKEYGLSQFYVDYGNTVGFLKDDELFFKVNYKYHQCQLSSKELVSVYKKLKSR